MLIHYDTTGLTVKRSLDTAEHVRLGVTEINIFKNDRRYRIGPMMKPHDQYTVGELGDLLARMERIPKCL
jgi:hypothetical protein